MWDLTRVLVDLRIGKQRKREKGREKEGKMRGWDLGDRRGGTLRKGGRSGDG